MVRKILNRLINIFISPAIRYKKNIIIGSRSYFINTFSLNLLENAKNKITIGDKCIIGASIIFESENAEVQIGNNVYLGDCKIISRSKVTFGNDILVSWGVYFYDHDSHSLNYIDRQKDLEQVLFDFENHRGNYLKNKNWSNVNSKPIVIKDNAWIGMEATILKGVTIGEGAIVGAHSVVTKDVPDYTVVAGNPAKVIKILDQPK